MKRSFIRGIWGDCANNVQMMNDIKNQQKLDGDLQFVCYTFGKKNHEYLQSLNIKSVLINDNELIYPYMFRHKYDVYNAAFQDFDEVVFLDWDCNLVGKYSDNMWYELGKKEVIQGCLYFWKRIVCPWRTERRPQSLLINTGFVYMRDKTLPNKFIEAYDKFPKGNIWRRNDETAVTFCMDKLMNGWQGEDYWFKNFEPEMCLTKCNPIFTSKPNMLFCHYHKGN